MTDTTDEKTVDPGTELIGLLMQHNYDSMTWTMNQLYNAERRQRLALEVWIDAFQDALHQAHGGTYRDYDKVMRVFAYPPTGFDQEDEWARMHRDWKEDL